MPEVKEYYDWKKLRREHPSLRIRSKRTANGMLGLGIWGKDHVVPLWWKGRNPTYQEWHDEIEPLDDEWNSEEQRRLLEKDWSGWTERQNYLDGKLRLTLHDALSDPGLTDSEKARLQSDYGWFMSVDDKKYMNNPIGRWASYSQKLQNIAGSAARGELNRAAAVFQMEAQLRRAQTDSEMSDRDFEILQNAFVGIMQRFGERGQRNPVDDVPEFRVGSIMLAKLGDVKHDDEPHVVKVTDRHFTSGRPSYSASIEDEPEWYDNWEKEHPNSKIIGGWGYDDRIERVIKYNPALLDFPYQQIRATKRERVVSVIVGGIVGLIALKWWHR